MKELQDLWVRVRRPPIVRKASMNELVAMSNRRMYGGDTCKNIGEMLLTEEAKKIVEEKSLVTSDYSY